MNQTDIFNAFNGIISKTAIINRDGEYMIRGKWCFIANEGNIWDIWLCNPVNLAAGLGTRKLRSMLQRLRGHVKTPFVELDGEAWCKEAGIEGILTSLAVLGIRKKKKVNLEHMKLLNYNLRAKI